MEAIFIGLFIPTAVVFAKMFVLALFALFAFRFIKGVV